MTDAASASFIPIVRRPLVAILTLALSVAFPHPADASGVVTTFSVGLEASPTTFAIDRTRHRAYASLPGTDQIAVIDTDAMRVVDWWYVGFAPFGVALDSVRDRLWVNGYVPGGSAIPTLCAIDLLTGSVLLRFNAGGADVAVDVLARRVYSTTRTSLVMLDADTGAVLASVATPAAANDWWGVKVDSAAARVYVTDVRAKQVFVFDAGSLATLDTISLQGVSIGMAIDEARHRLYLGTNPRGDNPLPPMVLHVIDTATDTLIADLVTPGFVDMVALDESGKTVYAMNKQFLSGGDRGSMTQIDATTLAVIRTVGVGGSPSGAVVESDGRIFAANQRDGTISVIPVDCCSPVIESVTVTPTEPHSWGTVMANVAAGDTLALRYQWIKNGVDIPGATSPWLSLLAPGHGDRGDRIAVRVVGSDGTSETPVVTSEAVTVMNAPPFVAGVSLSPSAPHTNDRVFAGAGPVSDDDGDPVTVSYQWTRNGADIGGATGPTLDLSAAGVGDKGDRIGVRAIGWDGFDASVPVTAELTVVNSSPRVVSVGITPVAAETNKLLTASVVAADDDGDGLTASYQWVKNGVDIPGATDASLDLSMPGDGDKGDIIAVRAAVSDGASESTAVTSPAVSIADSAPTAVVTLNTDQPRPNSTIVAAVAANDADRDALTFTFVWRTNGIVRRSSSTSSNTDGFDLRRPGNGNNGDVVSVEVTASDGELSVTTSASARVTSHPR